MPYVRFERPPAISSADSGRPSAPPTWSAKNPRGDSRSTPSGPPVVTRGSLTVRISATLSVAQIRITRSGDARSAGAYGAAGALRVARHPADGHVDAEPGGG